MTITSLSSIPNFHTLRIRGGVQGQCVMTFINGGVTLKFIESGLAKMLGLPTIDIGYFRVLLTGRHSMACTQWVQHL